MHMILMLNRACNSFIDKGIMHNAMKYEIMKCLFADLFTEDYQRSLTIGIYCISSINK